MPNLKKFILFTDLNEDIVCVQNQKQLYGLKDLEIRINGFKDEKFCLSLSMNSISMVDFREIDRLFNNYSKLVENVRWNVAFNYSKLFHKFKILPYDFFQKFNIFSIEIDQVDNYTHLSEFLKHCPCLENLELHFSNINSNLILDQQFMLNPSLRFIKIQENNPSNLKDYNLSFLSILSTISFHLVSSHISTRFINNVFKRRNKNNFSFYFQSHKNYNNFIFSIRIFENLFLLIDEATNDNFKFNSIQELIDYLIVHDHFKFHFLKKGIEHH